MSEEELFRLADAVVFLPAGFSLSALRTEARKGRLATVTIAGKQCTTRRAIQEMIELCRDQGSRLTSLSARKEDRTEEPVRSTSSGMDSTISAQDALRIRLSTPDSRYANTSRTKPLNPTPTNVTHLKSRSRTS